MEHADAQFNALLEHYNNTVSLISWLDDLIKMWTEWLKSFYLRTKADCILRSISQHLNGASTTKMDAYVAVSPDVTMESD